jgi:hypothetical protein
MGGQAGILYGAAEFSRDIDVAVLAEPENFSRFQSQMAAHAAANDVVNGVLRRIRSSTKSSSLCFTCPTR